jgi:hypothetical protein
MDMNMIRLAGAIALGIAGFLITTVTAFAQVPGPGAAARVWFYRDLNPYESLAEPYIRVDGGVTGSSIPGTAFYRDLPAGRHRVSVDSYINDKNQTIDVDAVPGRELYVKVVPNDDFVEGGGEYSGGYHRNSYVLWLYPPEVARPAIARSRMAAAAPPR